MHTFLILGCSSFVICLAFTPLCRNLFQRFGLVDKPDTHRKLHALAVPRLGGVPIAIAYTCALSLGMALRPAGSHLYIQHVRLLFALIPAGIVIFGTGLMDDLVGLRPWQKLAGQLAGSLCAVGLGARLTITHAPGWLCAALSVVWLIGCSNAVNLIDGMDGLATGVALLATITTSVVALVTGNIGLALAAIPLAGCLLAFLVFNFNPASIFLGDCGSLTIGFALGCFGLMWNGHTKTILGMIAPLMALALPLVDVALAIGRRSLRSVPIFSADRGHIHHKILSLGFSIRGTALMLYAVGALAASLAIMLEFSRWDFGWVILLVFLTLVLVGINRLGYIEFAAARRTFSHRTMLRAVKNEIFLHELNLALRRSSDLEELWELTREACRSLQFATVQLEFDGRSFSQQFVKVQGSTCRFHLTFGKQGSLRLTRIEDKFSSPITMAVLNLLRDRFEEQQESLLSGSLSDQMDSYLPKRRAPQTPVERARSSSAA